MSYTIQGKVHSLGIETSKPANNGKTYKSRDLIIQVDETAGSSVYANYPKFVGKTDKILQQMNSLQVGANVTLHFNIKGFNGERGNFTSLEVWKIDNA
jgi:hypothetical protein